jgi:Peptide-N-glycosidase F, C terminal/Secretion system C-terminal sorting domain
MRHYYLLMSALLLTLLSASPKASAAPGDTLRVPVVTDMRITRYGNYDTTALLPTGGGPYRKILLHYVLGRYNCGGAQYCGSWDYTTRVILRPPGADTLELTRVITPYATDWLPATGGPGRKHDYVTDVTDYAEQLTQGPRSLRYLYDGYSWGFTVTLYFEFIEGTPARDILGVKKVYEGWMPFGKTNEPIENKLTPKSIYIPGGPVVDRVELKNIITGHGSDGNQCAEFCSNYYEVYANNQYVTQQQLWRDNCGRNPVSPQTGTWVYDRANWCPGQAVQPLRHNLTQWATPGTNMEVNLDMEPYTSPTQGNTGGYIWHSQLLVCGPPNFSAADADLREIISPTTDPNYARDNPACAGAKVVLRNGGAAPLTSVTFRYKAGSGAWLTYPWTGNLAFLRDTVVALPLPSTALLSATGGTFTVVTEQPNGLADPNRYNDTLRSQYAATVALPAQFRVSFTTNASVVTGRSETSWRLLDELGAVVKQRVQNRASTNYLDTVNLAPGCYTLQVLDAGCDGLAWWANPNAGNGSLRLLRATSGQVVRSISGDFGCESNLRFRVLTPTGLADAALPTLLDVYPNPTPDGLLTLDFSLPTRQDVTVNVRALDGRLVRRTVLSGVEAGLKSLDLRGLPSGIYLLQCDGSAGARFWRRVAVN